MTVSHARTPLFDAHIDAGARMAPFAGYEMPVQYSGVIAEAKAVRAGSGMFDVSHMARLRLTGERVLEFLEHVTTNDVSGLTDGKGQYSLLPNATGGVVDDIIVYRILPNEFRMVVNASNHEKDLAWLHSQNTFGVEIADETKETAMIAIQGPGAMDVLWNLSPEAEALKGLPLFGLTNAVIAGVTCFAPRSGYTGEDGFELVCAAEDARKLWDALLSAGVTPCGLGARDALRVEAGLPLYGHELTDDLSPMAAGLGWVVSKTKEFVGSTIINQARADGTPTKLVGVRLDSKRLPQPGMVVYVQGDRVGEVSSGVYSPSLETGIAFAFVSREVPLDTPCELDVRGRMETGSITNKRFLKRK